MAWTPIPTNPQNSSHPGTLPATSQPTSQQAHEFESALMRETQTNSQANKTGYYDKFESQSAKLANTLKTLNPEEKKEVQKIYQAAASKCQKLQAAGKKNAEPLSGFLVSLTQLSNAKLTMLENADSKKFNQNPQWIKWDAIFKETEKTLDAYHEYVMKGSDVEH